MADLRRLVDLRTEETTPVVARRVTHEIRTDLIRNHLKA